MVWALRSSRGCCCCCCCCCCRLRSSTPRSPRGRWWLEIAHVSSVSHQIASEPSEPSDICRPRKPGGSSGIYISLQCATAKVAEVFPDLPGALRTPVKPSPPSGSLFLEMKLTSRRVPFFEPCMYMKLTTSPGLQRLRTRSVPCDGCADETGGDPLPREPLPVRR